MTTHLQRLIQARDAFKAAQSAYQQVRMSARRAARMHYDAAVCAAREADAALRDASAYDGGDFAEEARAAALAAAALEDARMLYDAVRLELRRSP